MIRVIDIYNFIDKIAPFDSALQFDNSGLLLGDKNKEVKNILVALDGGGDIIKNAIENNVDLIITHHPLIFEGLKSIKSETPIYRLIKNNIAVISAHTNYDIAEGGMNDCIAEKLGLKGIKTIDFTQGIGRIGDLETKLEAKDFIKLIKKLLNTDLRVSKLSGIIKRVAVVGGSGGEFLYSAIQAGADAYITGDVKHHVFLNAKDEEILLIDAGHFGTERIFSSDISKRVKDNFKSVEVIEAKEYCPYLIIN